MKVSPSLAALLIAVSGAVARALTPADIDAAAKIAADVSILRQISSDKFDGRNNDTPGSAAVQALLIRRLKKVAQGAMPGTSGDDAFRQPFVEDGERGTNLVAVIRGSELPDEYVMIGGHYDHLGTSCKRVRPGDVICNGATDNGGGTAVVVSIARAIGRLPSPPRRSILIALWDAEEDGLLGSKYYVEHPVFPLASTVAYLNFDVQGGVLLPSLRNKSFAVGAETGGAVLAALVDQAVARQHLDTRRVSYIFGQNRSDYANLVGAGVPTVFFADSTGPCYHSTGDELAVVDFPKLREQSMIGFRVAVALAQTDTLPTFTPTNPALATFDDALVLDDVFRAGLADLPLFSPADRKTVSDLQAKIATIAAEGRENFGSDDIAAMLLGTLDGINAILRLPCARY